jgi:hypothetical protein
MVWVLWFTKGVTFAAAFGRSSLQVPVKALVLGNETGLTVSDSGGVFFELAEN